MTTSAGQIDFDYDGRTPRLAQEVAIMLAPHLPGTTKEAALELAARIATLAEKRYKEAFEPVDPMRCHTCDEMTIPKTRVRVVVCPRCALEGRTPGSSG